MKVSVKLVSMSGQPPPGFDSFGKADIRIDGGSTLARLIDGLPLNPGETYLALVNGDTVAPSERRQRTLSDGDEIAIFPPMQGGAAGSGAARRPRPYSSATKLR